EQEGLQDYEDLQGYFTNRVNAIIKKNGKKAICWNDSLVANNLDTDIQIQYWTVQHAEQFKAFAERGGEFIISDMFHLYFDYPYAMTSLEKVFKYKQKPHIKNVDFSKYPGFLGLECCRWNEKELSNEQLEEMIFPRLNALFSAETHYRIFEEQLEKTYGEAARRGLSYKPLLQCNPKGKARREEVFAHMAAMNSDVDMSTVKSSGNGVAENKDFRKGFIKYFFKASDMPFMLKLIKGYR
ncbi:MAG: family 20 glycosylhydrolase, partial [Spirochaetaceae bacterium]|nr:family 20 glycosylhydrolase [Spirochaetaceae bacterium]